MRRNPHVIPSEVEGPRCQSLGISRGIPSTRFPPLRMTRLQRIDCQDGIDRVLCASINFLHMRHRLNGHSREEMERYVEECERDHGRAVLCPAAR